MKNLYKPKKNGTFLKPSLHRNAPQPRHAVVQVLLHPDTYRLVRHDVREFFVFRPILWHQTRVEGELRSIMRIFNLFLYCQIISYHICERIESPFLAVAAPDSSSGQH